MKIKPNDIRFKVEQQTEEDHNATGIRLSVMQISDPDNDNICDINHPDFDKYWDNDCEMIFSSERFDSIDDARDWCVSIGMTEDPNMEEVGG